MATVKNWFNEFQGGHMSTFYKPLAGIPETATCSQYEKALAQRMLHSLTMDHGSHAVFDTFVVVDETRIHYLPLVTKELPKQWTSFSEPPPERAKTVLAAGKVCESVYWDSQDVVCIDYLGKGHIIGSIGHRILL